MKKEMTIFYEVHDNIYVNLTNKCPCACTFCLRQTRDHMENSHVLWLEHAPSFEEVQEAMKAVDFSKYKEVVFWRIRRTDRGTRCAETECKADQRKVQYADPYQHKRTWQSGQ